MRGEKRNIYDGIKITKRGADITVAVLSLTLLVFIVAALVSTT